MDTFMDKLAEKFTAQEMIKANTAAEMEEVNRLKEQVQEYNECLDRMQGICAQMNQTAEAALQKVESTQFDSDGLKDELLRMWADVQQDQMDTIRTMVKAQLNSHNDGQVDQIRSILNEQAVVTDKKLAELQASMSNNTSQGGGSDEFVHRECVKVYRNVQAVVIEENNKQIETLDYTLKPTMKTMKSVKVIAILALLASLASVALQVVSMFNLI